MSRTKRHVPFNFRHYSSFFLTHEKLNPKYFNREKEDFKFIRWKKGLDKHKSTSEVYMTTSYGSKGYKEHLTGSTRKFFKKAFSKARRRHFKKDDRLDLG